jgi:hypothetical protein
MLPVHGEFSLFTNNTPHVGTSLSINVNTRLHDSSRGPSRRFRAAPCTTFSMRILVRRGFIALNHVWKGDCSSCAILGQPVKPKLCPPRMMYASRQLTDRASNALQPWEMSIQSGSWIKAEYSSVYRPTDLAEPMLSGRCGWRTLICTCVVPARIERLGDCSTDNVALITSFESF